MINQLIQTLSFLWSPLTFGVLIGIAFLFLWLAIAPSKAKRDKNSRVEGYLEDRDIIEQMQLDQSFWKRAVRPIISKLLRALSGFLPGRRIEQLQQQLTYAGEPGGWTAHDFMGIQMLLAMAFGVLCVLIMRILPSTKAAPLIIYGRNALICVAIGYLTPRVWITLRINERRREIIRTFSDALDLLSVGVEAGLAFDSAMLKVCDNWSNALTDEFRRTHLEMRVGTPRNVALQRMADRMGVQDVTTFVGVLIQSSELGVSISEVLHTQAEEVRIRRRMRAEELARQAGVKMVFALVFLVFPALMVVLLGPGLPGLFEALGGLSGG